MGTFRTRGLRGSAFEDMVNRTNEKYKEKGLALIQKIPTPITPISMNPDNHQITLAYFDQKSTVDYIGAVQGIPVCFDAKECAEDTFSLQKIHAHQVEFMKQFVAQKGIAFFLIYYTKREKLYYLKLADLLPFWERAEKGGRKSFRMEELDDKYFFTSTKGLLVPYLDMIQKQLEEEEGEDD